MRIVIDTNIWVSGLLWKGDSWRLLTLAEEGKVELCLSHAMLLELEEVLAYERLRPRLEALQETPAELAAYALSLPLHATYPAATRQSFQPTQTMTFSCSVRPLLRLPMLSPVTSTC